ncbi:hypothetical protein CHS0354_025582 [Potamilus streckersoni]|uniref:Uncharacterized protein n=1 Tax=Potamilus streckersoni TaxID=2493646 RepID=A0AAE0S1V8_9BIVA|nr:hypothetical protein CHS0354_025582 [Potamilus streckersoni]
MLQEIDNSKRTLAHNAALDGNVAVLSYLNEFRIDPWCRTSEEGTLLQRACINGQLEMTNYLVQTYPTMLHEVDNKRRTLTHNAALSGIIAVLSYIIKRGIDPWCRPSADETLLHRACINGQLEMTNYLVQTYPTMLHEVDNKRRTLTHNAALSGIIAVLSYIIKRGIDPWCRPSADETLLHRACNNGQLEMTKYLVQTYPTMLYELDDSKRTPAYNAALIGNVAVLSYLFKRGIDPWCKTSEEETLLHRACIDGQLKVTKYLIQTYPTVVHKVDNSTRTPAHNAALGGNVSVLSYLIDRGIDPWCRTSEEETLLHGACIDGQLEMTKYLVQTYPTMLHQLFDMQSHADYPHEHPQQPFGMQNDADYLQEYPQQLFDMQSHADYSHEYPQQLFNKQSHADYPHEHLQQLFGMQSHTDYPHEHLQQLFDMQSHVDYPHEHPQQPLGMQSHADYSHEHPQQLFDMRSHADYLERLEKNAMMADRKMTPIIYRESGA